MTNRQDGPRIMGIVNVTPDSFSDGGKYVSTQSAITHALQLANEGAQILDIGGESTRPGAIEVGIEEELQRVIPVIERLTDKTNAQISIDTRKPEVAIAAMEAGATIWNDVSALTFSENSLSVAAQLQCNIILMHAQGAPETMQDNPCYENVVREVSDWLLDRVKACEVVGIKRDRLVIDPGIGFGKTVEHNLALLAELESLHDLGLPILIGASRKRFIAALDQQAPIDERLGGSIAAALIAAQQGAAIVRVHDVAQTRQALAIWAAALGLEGN